MGMSVPIYYRNESTSHKGYNFLVNEFQIMDTLPWGLRKKQYYHVIFSVEKKIILILCRQVSAPFQDCFAISFTGKKPTYSNLVVLIVKFWPLFVSGNEFRRGWKEIAVLRIFISTLCSKKSWMPGSSIFCGLVNIEFPTRNRVKPGLWDKEASEKMLLVVRKNKEINPLKHAGRQTDGDPILPSYLFPPTRLEE